MQKVWITVFKVKVTMRYRTAKDWLSYLLNYQGHFKTKLVMMLHHHEQHYSVKKFIMEVKVTAVVFIHCVPYNFWIFNSLPSNLVCWGIINDYYHIKNDVFVLLSVIKVKVTCFKFVRMQTVLHLNYLPQTWHTGTSKPHKHGLLSRLWTRSQGSNSHRMFVNRFLLIYKTFCSKTCNAGTH